MNDRAMETVEGAWGSGSRVTQSRVTHVKKCHRPDVECVGRNEHAIPPGPDLALPPPHRIFPPNYSVGISDRERHSYSICVSGVSRCARHVYICTWQGRRRRAAGCSAQEGPRWHSSRATTTSNFESASASAGGESLKPAEILFIHEQHALDGKDGVLGEEEKDREAMCRVSSDAHRARRTWGSPSGNHTVGK